VRDHLQRMTAQIAVPFGFTLTISGVIISSAARWHSPGMWDAWLFVAGAFCAHLVLTLVARVRTRPADGQSPLLINVVPLIAVPLAVGGSEWIESRELGYLAAGFLGCGLYVAGVAVSAAVWTRFAGRRRPREVSADGEV